MTSRQTDDARDAADEMMAGGNLPPEMKDSLKKVRREELRDRFAIAALQGILASDGAKEQTHENAAEEAYDIADAMMKARAT